MKKIITAAFFAASVCGTADVFAGEIENLAAGAQKTFSLTSFSGNTPGFLPAAPAPAAAEITSAAGDYKKLADAFKKGTVPAKEDLTGWNAGRFLDKDFPEYPGSLLLAGGETQPAGGAAGVFKIVPFKLDGSPDFYERLSADIAGGVAIMIKEMQARVTAPVFGPAEASFELILPSYKKGFSRYALRKAADGRILVKHVWKDDFGSSGSIEGASYGYFTKNVTPKPRPRRRG